MLIFDHFPSALPQHLALAASSTLVSHQLLTVSTMRSAPVFQPALNTSRSFPQLQACNDSLTFAAHYPSDNYAASLASGAARLELWTDLPVSTSNAASSSRNAAWKAVQLHYVQAAIGRNIGYSFVAKVKCSPESADGVFGFTYRIVHPDGQIDWIGSPSNDGQI